MSCFVKRHICQFFLRGWRCVDDAFGGEAISLRHLGVDTARYDLCHVTYIWRISGCSYGI